MKLNQNLKLILRNIYSYDISACHYNILKNYGFDLSEINKDDKTKRNIQIGYMMRDNPRITELLRGTTESLIEEYLKKNEIKEEELVIRQYDGFLVTRPLHTTQIGGMPLDLRNQFLVFISSIKRNSYIAIDKNMNVKIKGIPYRYDKMDEMYKKICNAAISGKETVFKNLQKIKDEIMTSKDPFLYGIPVGERKFNVFLKFYGEIEVNEQILKIMDLTDIDRAEYFKFYLDPFTKSIVYELAR